MAFHRSTLLFVSLLPASIQLACAEMAIPSGFEDLAKTQRLWTEVSLYGESLGLFEIDTNLETVTFIRPQALIAAVKRQFNDDPALLASVSNTLAAPLPRNGNLACSSNGSAPGCDYIDTPRAAIIYDENNARINLFFDKQYLPRRTAGSQWYQPTHGSENALIHQQNINFVADRDYQSATVQGSGALAVTEDGYFNLDWVWLGQRSRHQQQQNVTVNNAWYRQDISREHYIQLGEMDTRDLFSNTGGNISLSQLPLGKIRGLRAGSTRAWINPIQLSHGTPLSVLLSHDARIDARRGDQLLASFYLNAGAQTLDTRSFPEGSYTVTLAIYENNRLTRTEHVPFTRTGITPFDRFEWFIQGGETNNDEPGESRSAVAQAGIRLPLASALALTSGVTATRERRFMENAVDWSQGFNTGPIDGVLSSSFNIRGLNIYGSANVFKRNDDSRSGSDKGGYLSLNLSLANNPQREASSYTSLGATWQEQQNEKNQLSYSVAHNWYVDARGENEYGLSASGINSNSLNTSAYTRQGGRFGNVSLMFSDFWDRNARSHTPSGSGNYSSTFALSRSGLWLGRWSDGRPASAVAVNVSTPEESETSRVAVSLDNGGSADIPANSQGLFTVPGYRQTTLTINESLNLSHGASSEITQGSGSRTVFMVPGKLLHREVHTSASYTWVGRLTDERHAPLTGGVPLNVNGWNDLGQGGFSAQSDVLLHQLYMVSQQQFYQCALNVKSMRDVVRYVGTITCRGMTFSALPETVQQQAQLMLTRHGKAVDATVMNTDNDLKGK